MSTPTVSVVIPTYNRANLVSQAIESALAQTHPPHEVIVVDDGSTDDTVTVGAKYGPVVRYLRQTNSGPSVARNLGVDAATGDWIALLDSDDLWLPTKLEKQLRLLRQFPDAAACYCDFQYVDLEGRLLEEHSGFREPRSRDATFCQLLDGCPIPTPTLVIRRDCLAGGLRFEPDIRYGQDWDLFARLADRYSFIAVPEPLVLIRKHASNITNGVPDELTRDVLKVIDRVFTLDSAKPYKRRKSQAIAQYATSAAVGCLRQRDCGRARGWAMKALWHSPTQITAWKCLIRAILRMPPNLNTTNTHCSL